MIRRLTLTAGLAVLCTVAFAAKVSAQAAPATETLEFTGTVGSVCSFPSSDSVGTLEAAPDNKSLEASNGIPGTSNLGSPVEITVRCSSGGTVTVATPEQTNGPSWSGGSFAFAYSSTLSPDITTSSGIPGNVPSSFSLSENTTPLTIPSNDEVTLNVGMLAVNGEDAPLPDGNYTFNVTVTASPD
jgi:hypothetical protein